MYLSFPLFLCLFHLYFALILCSFLADSDLLRFLDIHACLLLLSITLHARSFGLSTPGKVCRRGHISSCRYGRRTAHMFGARRDIPDIFMIHNSEDDLLNII